MSEPNTRRKVSGGCLCGALRYEVDGNVSSIWLCHCSKCRRSGGSAFHPAALCRRSQFRWISGENARTTYRTESGYTVNFCTTCGSPAPFLQDGVDHVVLSAGSLDADFDRPIVRHIFVGSKAPWWQIHDDLPQFDAHVEDAEPRE